MRKHLPRFSDTPYCHTRVHIGHRYPYSSVQRGRNQFIIHAMHQSTKITSSEDKILHPSFAAEAK